MYFEAQPQPDGLGNMYAITRTSGYSKGGWAGYGHLRLVKYPEGLVWKHHNHSEVRIIEGHFICAGSTERSQYQIVLADLRKQMEDRLLDGRRAEQQNTIILASRAAMRTAQSIGREIRAVMAPTSHAPTALEAVPHARRRIL